eukprot:TRINITY_DN1217_c0_g1_i1.p1 TRINITY_DN1217_c0_g1~~TRINITY_DN1217_c0_g1_i1.p1  ORF type:complete len:189 (+),score=62.88 TRINITY_DN1217_c0_g1_i1:1-567(+)
MIEEILRPILIALIVILSLYILKNFFFPEKYRPPIPLPPPKPERLKFMNKQELIVYNGTDNERIYVGIKDRIFDVTRGKNFYGPNCSYNSLTGKDSTVALGKMDLNKDFGDLKYDSLDKDEKEVADDWENKFLTKYDLVAILYDNEEDKKNKEELENVRYEKELNGWNQKLIEHEKKVEEIKRLHYSK